MNEAEIAGRFIRAAEIERALPLHVGPMPLRAQRLPYVHTWSDKAGWRKEPGDRLQKGDDPLAEERRLFWEASTSLPTAAEIRDMDDLYSLLLMVDGDKERRSLLAWARAKAGGKPFRRWCFDVEHIHPETGRRRKDRALAMICTQLDPRTVQHNNMARPAMLQGGHVIGHNSGTLDDDAAAGRRPCHWMADGAFAGIHSESPADFSWAQKRWQRSRRRHASRQKPNEA